MTRFEYRVVNVPLGDTRQATEQLNRLGEDGWDAYYAVQHNQNLVTFLKRELIGYQGPREKREEAKPELDGRRGAGRPRKDVAPVTPTLPVDVEFPAP